MPAINCFYKSYDNIKTWFWDENDETLVSNILINMIIKYNTKNKYVEIPREILLKNIDIEFLGEIAVS